MALRAAYPIRERFALRMIVALLRFLDLIEPTFPQLLLQRPISPLSFADDGDGVDVDVVVVDADADVDVVLLFLALSVYYYYCYYLKHFALPHSLRCVDSCLTAQRTQQPIVCSS